MGSVSVFKFKHGHTDDIQIEIHCCKQESLFNKMRFCSAPLAAKEKSGVPPIQTLMDDFSQLDTTQSPRVTDLLSRTSAYQSSSIRSPRELNN